MRKLALMLSCNGMFVTLPAHADFFAGIDLVEDLMLGGGYRYYLQ